MLDVNFCAPRRAVDAWFFAGLASSYPDITTSDGSPLFSRVRCGGLHVPACKVFHVPLVDSSNALELDLDDAASVGLDNQVLIFQYQGKFHAIDHVSSVDFLG